MKHAPAAASAAGIDWAARGVQHELLLRMLRALRHDLMAPLSVARLSASMVKRRLGATPPDAPAALQRLGELEAHLAELAHSLRELRHWDPDQASAPMGLNAAAALCAEWFRAPLAMRGFTLAEAVAVAPGPAAPLPRNELLYVIAGLLAHVQDCWDACAVQLAAHPAPVTAIEVRGSAAAPSAAAEEAAAALRPSATRVDAAALALHLRALGWTLHTVAPRHLRAERVVAV